jgi:hypothetical protein
MPMTDVLTAVLIAAMVIYVWMIQPIKRFRRRGNRPRLPDPWVT